MLDQNGVLKSGKIFIISLCAVILLLVLLVNADVKDLISPEIINTSVGNSSQGGGFVVYASNGMIQNGSALSIGPMLGSSWLNLSGIININMSLIANGSHGGFVNVTFGWVLTSSNGSTMLNTTVYNYTVNQTAFNYSFNTNLLADGIYNISVSVMNVSVGGGNGNVTINYSRGMYLGVDRTAPNVSTAWYNNSFDSANNLSTQFNTTSVSILLFNASVNDSTLSVQEVRFGFYNQNDTGFNITAIKSGAGTYTANITTNISVMIDGLYTVVVYGNDTLNNANRTNNLTFYLDRSAPNVTVNFDSPTGTTLVNGNFSLRSSNRTFNVSMRDLVNVSSVYFVFRNASGTDFNVSAVNDSGNWWVSYNVSLLAEGNNVVTIFTNDTLGNINTTQNFTFILDNVNPVVAASSSGVSSTAATLSATVNESVTSCAYSVTNGAGSGNLTISTGGTSFSATLALLPSTDYTATVTCTDFAGNQATKTTTFTSSAVASTSNGGGGAGGSSGGVSSAVQGQLAKETWSSINAGETAKVEVPNGAVGVTEVSFTVPQTVYGAWVQVAKKDKLPSSVSSFEGKVYKNLEISKGPALNKEGSFTDATVKFKVEKAWLADNKLTTESVALFHYADNKWNKLQTQVGEDDGTYVHYSAKTPGFSYFVIGQSEQAAPAVEAPAAQPAAPSEQQAAPAEAPAMEKKGLSTGTVAALVVAALVVVALVWYFRKRR